MFCSMSPGSPGVKTHWGRTLAGIRGTLAVVMALDAPAGATDAGTGRLVR